MHTPISRLSATLCANLAASPTGSALLRRGIAGPRMIWLYGLLAGALWVFASIAEDVVTADRITTLDQQVSVWLHVHASPVVTRIALALTHAHGTIGILVLSALVGYYLWRRRDEFWLAVIALGVPGSVLLNAAVKQVFQRARPEFDHPLLTLLTYSFPSGHAAAASAFYGILSAYLVTRSRSAGSGRGVQAALILGAVTMIALVGWSRMYLGVHYLSDVLAAIAESSAWLAFTFLVCEWGYAKFVQAKSSGLKTSGDSAHDI